MESQRLPPPVYSTEQLVGCLLLWFHEKNMCISGKCHFQVGACDVSAAILVDEYIFKILTFTF